MSPATPSMPLALKAGGVGALVDREDLVGHPRPDRAAARRARPGSAGSPPRDGLSAEAEPVVADEEVPDAADKGDEHEALTPHRRADAQLALDVEGAR